MRIAHSFRRGVNAQDMSLALWHKDCETLVWHFVESHFDLYDRDLLGREDGVCTVFLLSTIFLFCILGILLSLEGSLPSANVFYDCRMLYSFYRSVASYRVSDEDCFCWFFGDELSFCTNRYMFIISHF